MSPRGLEGPGVQAEWTGVPGRSGEADGWHPWERQAGKPARVRLREQPWRGSMRPECGRKRLDSPGDPKTRTKSRSYILNPFVTIKIRAHAPAPLPECPSGRQGPPARELTGPLALWVGSLGRDQGLCSFLGPWAPVAILCPPHLRRGHPAEHASSCPASQRHTLFAPPLGLDPLRTPTTRARESPQPRWTGSRTPSSAFLSAGCPRTSYLRPLNLCERPAPNPNISPSIDPP